MIIKNLTRSANTSQLFKYIFRYVQDSDKVSTQEKESLVFRHNVRATTLQEQITEFATHEKLRIHKSKNQSSVHHTILSWSPKDAGQLTDEKVSAMVQEYIRLRGIENKYYGTVHRDKGHLHVHLIMSGTKFNGLSSRISKSEFAQLKTELQHFQERTFPELSNSLPDIDNTNALANPDIKQSKKSRLASEIRLLQESSTSKEHFLKELSTKYEIYIRGDKPYGIISEGRKFRFSTLQIVIEDHPYYGLDLPELAKVPHVQVKPEQPQEPQIPGNIEINKDGIEHTANTDTPELSDDALEQQPDTDSEPEYNQDVESSNDNNALDGTGFGVVDAVIIASQIPFMTTQLASLALSRKQSRGDIYQEDEIPEKEEDQQNRTETSVNLGELNTLQRIRISTKSKDRVR